MLDPGLLNLW